MLRGRKPSTDADLRAALASLSIEQAQRRLEELEERRAALLIDGSDADIRAAERDIESACLLVQRTVAAQKELEKRVSAAEAAEAHAELSARRDAAEAEAQACAKAVAKDYPRLARELVQLLERLQAAENGVAEFRAVDPDDVFVAPNKYQGKPIELRRMRCFHADKDEYRCTSSNGTMLLVLARGVTPQEEKDLIEERCGEIKKITTPACLKTIRLTPVVHEEDTISGYLKRTIIGAASIEVSPSAAPSSRGRR
jgi:hypothetical protein